MKTVVSVNEISELEIKPKAELATWKQSVASEIQSRWNKQDNWINLPCPVCGSAEHSSAFNKVGFAYVECMHCSSLYAKTRPSSNELNWWYTRAASTDFWKKKLLPLSAVSRDAKIIEPRANWILDGLSEYLSNISLPHIKYTDVSFFGKALVEKIAGYANGMEVVAAGLTEVDLTYSDENIHSKPLHSIDAFSSLPESDVVVAIDVLERIPSVREFIEQMEKVVIPGGLVFATCPVSSGFEIQSLWDQSPTIIPPDKLNLPSIKGLIELFSASGKWKILELSTPGMFDVEAVKQTMALFPDKPWPRSLHALVDGIDRQGEGMFTEYLQSQRLSSFARIVLRREQNKIL